MIDPLRKAFLQQRATAKYRGIAWRLEYWEWLQIWQDSGRLHERGTKSGQWVMGRNGDVGAYETGNVKIIQVGTNNTLAVIGRHRKAREAGKYQGFRKQPVLTIQ